jgi:N-acetylmuramoyl-L-alanine amidase
MFKNVSMKKLISVGFIALLSLSFIFTACFRNPYKATNKMHTHQIDSLTDIAGLTNNGGIFSDSVKQSPYWIGTTNFGLRKPNFVIIHHTAQNACEETLKTFITPRTAVSAHYVICKDGTIHQMLNDYMRAQHAGISKWGNLIDINSSSIGIELDNNGFEPFDSLQINSLLVLLNRLKQKYTIPTANFIGHGDIAPTRKNDPNFRFPWNTLSKAGFGLWFDEILPPAPTNFNPYIALRIIGYDLKDTTAAVRSFKRHFLQDTTKRLNAVDTLVLSNLQRKYF